MQTRRQEFGPRYTWGWGTRAPGPSIGLSNPKWGKKPRSSCGDHGPINPLALAELSCYFATSGVGDLHHSDEETLLRYKPAARPFQLPPKIAMYKCCCSQKCRIVLSCKACVSPLTKVVSSYYTIAKPISALLLTKPWHHNKYIKFKSYFI